MIYTNDNGTIEMFWLKCAKTKWKSLLFNTMLYIIALHMKDGFNKMKN